MIENENIKQINILMVVFIGSNNPRKLYKEVEYYG